MAKSDYLKGAHLAFALQLKTFAENIGEVAATLGVTPTEVADAQKAAERFDWELQVLAICSQCAQSFSAWKDITRYGGAYPISGAPVMVDWPSPEPPPVAPGLEKWFRALANRIKSHANYTPAVGQLLGIEGADMAMPDLSEAKPDFGVKLTSAGVELGWTWQGLSKWLYGCELEVDRGDGQGRRPLSVDNVPKYIDTHPLPATPQKWTYWAVFRDREGRVGQWSNPISITVGG